jgi:hypothetical protein
MVKQSETSCLLPVTATQPGGVALVVRASVTHVMTVTHATVTRMKGSMPAMFLDVLLISS